MSRHERLNSILAILTDQGYLDVEDAVERLDVSAATIRRDFDHLARQQLLTRTHGGAAAVAGTYDLPLGYKIARHAEAKQRIARAAAALVPVGSSVALNGGTTTTEVARTLASRDDIAQSGDGPAITVVTNALNIATELAVRNQVKIVVIGGVARPQSYELIGPLGASLLDQIHVDTTFLGVDGIDPDGGATTHHEGEAVVNRGLAMRARRLVIVADSSKLGRAAFARICPSSDVDVLVTDSEPSDELRRGFEDRGVQIIVAGGDSAG